MTETKTYAEAATDGASDGKKRRGGNGAAGNNNNNNNKFSGECSELKGHVFDTQSHNPKEGFFKTTRHLASYVGRTYTRAGEFRIALETLELEELKPPSLDPSLKTDVVAVELWKIELQEYRDDVKYRKENLQKVFALILGQCTTSMKDRLHGKDGWDTINRESDVIQLLKAIQEYSTTKTSDQDSSHKLMDAEIAFLTFRQKKLTNADYLIAFKDRVEVLERVKGERLGTDKARVDRHLAQQAKEVEAAASDDSLEDDESVASNRTLTKSKEKSPPPPIAKIEDPPGAFMQADMDETVHVKFAGEIADLLCRVDPKFYRPYVVRERGKRVVYCELRKALYGTLQAALLFWEDLSTFLTKELGFELNPYDNCVANKTIDGKQMTILWHVDDLKMSHVDQEVLEDILRKLNEKYGKEAPLTVTRGNKHDYLGMMIEYGDDGSVTFNMTDFVEGILDEAPDDMAGSAVTPAANYLFTVNENADKLNDDAAELFHHLVAKLLYVCKRARPDIHTAVAFLTTRVMQPDIDDYNKLARCIKYLRETPDLTLRLEVNESGVLEWWVDASFAVHPDMKGHTGAMMTMGKGAVYSMSTRQKVNTKSITICELVGVDDAMPNIIWIRRFLEAQSYSVTDNVIYQDNQSAMLLEKNGRRSCGKNTRHIDIRYFFITDRIAHGDCRVEYCPTDEMDADPFTKPLQGSKFRKFRQRMLNIPTSYRFANHRQNDDSLTISDTASYNRTNTPQECVETRVRQGGLKDPTSDSVMMDDMSVPIEDDWIQIKRRRGKQPIPTE